MLTCSHCAGFVPASVSSCPNCEAPLAKKALRAAKQMAKAGAAAATMVTLMACYGMAYPPPAEPVAMQNDRDGDGFEAAPSGAAPSPAYDCDDTSKDVHPGANDPIGDALDQNCDGMDGSATSSPPPTATMATDPPPEMKPQPPAVAK